MNAKAKLVGLVLMAVTIAATLSCGVSSPSSNTEPTSTRGQAYFGELVEARGPAWQARFYLEYAASILAAMEEAPLPRDESRGDVRTYRLLVSRSVNEQTVITLSVKQNRCAITEKTLDNFAALEISGETEEILKFEAGDLRVEAVPCSPSRANDIERQFQLAIDLPDSLPPPSMVDGTWWVLESNGAGNEYRLRIVWDPHEPALLELARVLSLVDEE